MEKAGEGKRPGLGPERKRPQGTIGPPRKERLLQKGGWGKKASST
jgi:hypothetical protein